MNETVMYQLKEISQYMMCFVIITRENNCIVIDGGRPEDMDELKQYVGGRHISAWILTHAHNDHISGLISEMEKNGGADFDIEAIYYNFPPYDAWMKLVEESEADPKHGVVPAPSYMREELNEMLPAFGRVLPIFQEKAHIVSQGDHLQVDEIGIDFIFSWHEGLYANPMNDSSLVFMLHGPKQDVLFLGDLGPDAGDILFFESKDRLKADMVQMAHHGHMNVGLDVYAKIDPRVCLWCAPKWLYEEPEVPPYLADREKMIRMKRQRMYGEALTRQWMEQLGVKEHFVSYQGPHRFVI